tara:strand:+ start:880 stop:1590 length:711 start_codon:yes stop_codon:yes gene_type:complete
MKKNDVLKLAEAQGGWSMSDFQSRYFVVNSQVTDYRRVRQALLEIETRIAAKKQIIRDSKRSEIQLRIKERDLTFETQDLEKELILLDIDQLQYDISVYEKKLRIVEEELNEFAKLVLEIVPSLVELEKYTQHNEELEREYWIYRMAKQASVDMVTTGRIGAGNLDSIAMMAPEDQALTIGSALLNSKKLTSGINRIEEAINTDANLLTSNFTGLFSKSELLGLKSSNEKVDGEDI